MALEHPKVPIFAVMTCMQLQGLGCINFFPTIAGTLGFNTAVTLLVAAPPWIATVVGCLIAWCADRPGKRFMIWVPSRDVIVGYIIGVSTLAIRGRYVIMFLTACSIALTLVWVSNITQGPPVGRSAAIAIVNGFSNPANMYIPLP